LDIFDIIGACEVFRSVRPLACVRKFHIVFPYAPLEYVPSRVLDARVDIARLREREASRGLRGVFEDIGRRLIDRDGAGIRRRVGVFLTDVDLLGLKRPFLK
jgi:hypothetical protein